MFNTAAVIRFADRWFDRAHPDCIDRQGKLLSCVVLVTIFHAIMSIAFVKMEEWQRQHAKPYHELHISFAGMIEPQEFTRKSKAQEEPDPLNLITIQNRNTGSQSGAKLGQEQAASKAKIECKGIESNKLRIRQTKTEMIQRDTNEPSLIKNQQQQISNEDPSGLISSKIASVDPSQQELGIRDGNNQAEAEKGDGNGVGISGIQAGNYGRDDDPPGEAKTPSEQMKQLYEDIAPYHKDLLTRIAKEWKVNSKHAVRVLVWLTIAKDGRLLRSEIIETSGNKRIDKQTLETVREIEYAPLPDWCKRDHLSFKVDLRNFE